MPAKHPIYRAYDIKTQLVMCFYAKKHFVTICACKFEFVILNLKFGLSLFGI